MRVDNLEHPPRLSPLVANSLQSSPGCWCAVSGRECELFISKVSQIDFSGCCLVNTVLTEDMFRLFPPVSPCSSASDPVSVSTRAGSNTVTSLVIITSPVSSVSSGNCKFLQSFSQTEVNIAITVQTVHVSCSAAFLQEFARSCEFR